MIEALIASTTLALLLVIAYLILDDTHEACRRRTIRVWRVELATTLAFKA